MLYNNLKTLIERKQLDGFIVNNKIVSNIPIRMLLKERIKKPEIQRILDRDKMLEIVKYQDNYYKSGNKCFNFMGLINIHSCIETNTDYLVDGQHRYESLKELYDTYNYENENVVVEVVCVKTEKELINNYNIINKNTELPEFPEDIDKNVAEEAALYFFNKYPEIFVTTRRTRRPHINKNLFQEAIGVLNSEINNKLSCVLVKEDLIDIVNDKNDKMRLWPVASYQNRIRKMKSWETYKRLADSYGFYLGMYTSCDRENYLFRWVKDIIHERTGEEIKKVKKKNTKRRIPKIKRKMVWETHMGNVINAKCFCCGIVEISALNFECGHIISEAKGGDEGIDNLRPICSSCNKSMGIQNMYHYMKLNYKENYLNNAKEMSEF